MLPKGSAPLAFVFTRDILDSMSFSLSFSTEFFLAEGEPYDRHDHAVNASGQPISVWSALLMMPSEAWTELAREVFGCAPELLAPETVLDKIQETDTCSALTVPVRVWIDSDGDYFIDVWEN